MGSRQQQGLSLIALIIGLIVVAMVALGGMKVIPSYLEYRSAKNAIDAIARERQGATVADIRRAFDNRSAIDDINTVKAADLEITKEGNEVVISFSYRKDVPLFATIGVYLDFAASSKATDRAGN
jgi:Tfp pilus assembly protein PilX